MYIARYRCHPVGECGVLELDELEKIFRGLHGAPVYPLRMAHEALAVKDGYDGGRCGVEGHDEAVSMEGDGGRGKVIVVEGHDGVDAEREGWDRVLLEYKL